MGQGEIAYQNKDITSKVLERVLKIIPAICTPHFAENLSQI